MSLPPQPSPEALLAQAGWIQELARSMAHGADAEDVAQEALLAGLEGARGPVHSLRAWLTGVVRNRVRQDAREAGARSSREQQAARDEALPSAAELCARLSVHRAVAGEVEALGEPYRSTVLLRYFEGLSQSEIAARTGTPVATVNSRLTRALAQLRERLERRHAGDGGAWLAAILPLGMASGAHAPTSAGLLGALLMSKSALALSAVALTIAALVLFVGGDPTPSAEVAASLESPLELAQPVLEPAPGDTRTAADEAPSELATPRDLAPVAPPPEVLVGHVYDESGRPLPGARVRIARPYEDAHGERLSDASGRFEFPAPPDSRLRKLHATRNGYTELVHAEVQGSTRSVAIVLAPTLVVDGRVLDEAGVPVPGAEVVLGAGSVWRTRFPFPFESSRTGSWRTVADASGHFRLSDVPGTPGAYLYAEDDRRRSATQDLDLSATLDLELVLRAAPPGSVDVVHGRVLDEDGAPVEDAWVSIGHAGRKSDARGEFALPRGLIEAGYPLWAAKPGLLPGQVPAPAPRGSSNAGWPDEVEVRLGGPALSIQGRLVDSEGRPFSNREVWLEDPTTFGSQGGWWSHLEAVLAGGRGDTVTLTGAQGQFRFDGLLDRTYDLAAADNRTLRFARAPAVLAGRVGVELVLEDEQHLGPIEGRVVDAQGRPLAGVQVDADALLRRWDYDGLSHNAEGESVGHAITTTDDEGRFAFEDVPACVRRIALEGEGLIAQSFDLAPGASREGLRLVAASSRHVRVEVGGPWLEADEFELHDAQGTRLWMHVKRSRGSSRSTRWNLHEGRSGVVSVSDTAHWLVLLKDGDELERTQLAPLGEGVTTLRAD